MASFYEVTDARIHRRLYQKPAPCPDDGSSSVGDWVMAVGQASYDAK